MIQISLDKVNKYKSKPDKVNYSQINHNLVNGWTQTTIEEASYLITNGCSFSCGKFDGARKASKWKGQQVFAIDIDDIDSPKPNEAIEIIKNTFGHEPSLVYNSFSSTFKNNKYRILIAANSIVVEPLLALSILRGLTTILQADKACLDLARLFYGTTPDKQILVNKSQISTDLLIKFGEQYPSKVKTVVDIKKPVDSINQLKQHQVVMLMKGLKFKREYLLSNGEHRYNKLKNFCCWLMNLNFMSADLAKYIVAESINGDFDLMEHYITTWDKDYQYVSTQIIEWCEENYG